MNTQNSTRPILICGSPRSGTSMTAGIIFYLGVFLGEKFFKRNKHNPLGFFENKDFCKMDDVRVVEENAFAQQNKKSLQPKKKWEKELKRLIAYNSGFTSYGFERWGWKTPSAIHFLDDIVRIADPQIVWCYRGKNNNVASLKNMQWVSEAEEIFDDREKKREEAVKKHKIHLLEYESMLENTEYEVGRLVGALGLHPSKKKVERAIWHVVKELDINAPLEEESFTKYL